MPTARFPGDSFPTYLLVDKRGDSWDTGILQNLWNGLLKEHDLPFRTFHVGSKSTPASRAKWFSIYLERNAHLFDHHEKNPCLEDVYESFQFFLRHSCRRIAEMGLSSATEALQRPINARLTIWKFIDPVDAMLWLCGRGDGWIDQDLERRREKAKLIKSFRMEVTQFIDNAVRFSGSDQHSNARLAAALNKASRGLDLAAEDLQFEAKQ